MKHAIVTGASKGLGKAFAELLAAKGYDLFLVARSEELLVAHAEALSKKYNIRARVLATDLSQPQAAMAVVNGCAQYQLQPSVLINNAGYACWGFFDHLDFKNQAQMMQVNMGTLAQLTYHIIPLLKKNSPAYILNVASTAAYQAVPTMILYAASKAFVRSFSRGLRYELRKSGVSVTCLSPGPVATNFIEQAGMQALQATANKFEMTAEVAAKKGLNAMFRQKGEYVPGLVNYLTVKFSNVIPDWILERIAANIYMSKLK